MGTGALMRVWASLIAFAGALCASAQPTVVHWAYGPFGTPGDPAYVVADGRIYLAAGAYGQRGPCLFTLEAERVFHAADPLGRPGACAFVLEGGRLIRAQGR